MVSRPDVLLMAQAPVSMTWDELVRLRTVILKLASIGQFCEAFGRFRHFCDRCANDSEDRKKRSVLRSLWEACWTYHNQVYPALMRELTREVMLTGELYEDSPEERNAAFTEVLERFQGDLSRHLYMTGIMGSCSMLVSSMAQGKQPVTDVALVWVQSQFIPRDEFI